MTSKFTRLIRFEDPQGKIHYGEAGADWKLNLQGQTLPTYDITSSWASEFPLSGQKAEVAKILSPLETIPLMFGIGLNYKSHAEEANLPIPSYPVLFTKFGDVLAGPYQDIPIPLVAKDLDYEGELCVVIGKDAKNLAEDADLSEYILGYTTGNDVSARFWAWPKQSGGQYGHSKSFDQFGPIGPVITSPAALGDPQNLCLKTWVNGEIKQNNNTNNMIFDVAAVVRHMSQGITLKRGTVIMTGTPDGVLACKKSQVYLNSGDLVEVEIEKIGKIANKMVFTS
ncbi:uncharacterized protein A1O5_08548 [Cladophialophora psammophila CBS 110553]|uniref:Fumarylacetoacetase-like C-terminal domain-containing protein n=1 Tax=Cladophialophora psammophila CBS 110553 TaxID=1182543 RepID=W9XBX2_9EURO|nr:uncharacterized protein A1O5_08548 [Cladophialophora psammophila CBS 110553]EXJ67934.1 hypothetical protein A1O5_08548 [Cladophialophora psammophila CBS 110553]